MFLVGRKVKKLHFFSQSRSDLVSENGYFLSDVTATSWKIIEQSFVSTVYNVKKTVLEPLTKVLVAQFHLTKYFY